jgi:hypothetical protein
VSSPWKLRPNKTVSLQEAPQQQMSQVGHGGSSWSRSRSRTKFVSQDQNWDSGATLGGLSAHSSNSGASPRTSFSTVGDLPRNPSLSFAFLR